MMSRKLGCVGAWGPNWQEIREDKIRQAALIRKAVFMDSEL